MNINEVSTVSSAKRAALIDKMKRLNIDPRDIEETFTKGSGKGGQKINKTSNKVVLFYKPLNLIVASQRERERSVNRFVALRELVDQIELQISPDTSPRKKQWERVRRQKDRIRR